MPSFIRSSLRYRCGSRMGSFFKLTAYLVIYYLRGAATNENDNRTRLCDMLAQKGWMNAPSEAANESEPAPFGRHEWKTTRSPELSQADL